MRKELKTIAINTERTVPNDSQPILAWDDAGKCYYMMTRSELMGHYDRKFNDLKESCEAKIARLEKEFAEYKAKLDADFARKSDELETKYRNFTKEIAEISQKMVNLVEAVDKGGK